MSAHPIYDQLQMETYLGARVNCDACVLEYGGWCGPGCCEICDQYSAEHSCMWMEEAA